MEIKQLKTKLLKSVYLLLALISIASGQAWAESTITFYHQDALGSNIATTNQNGDVIWNEEYQPYGEKIYELGKDATTGNQDWYTGKNYDEDLDLTYFGARWYDAKQGRFLSVDPAPLQPGNIHTFNRYHYANNNPYRFVDPDGEFAAAALLVVGVAVSTFVTIDNAINEYDRNTSVTSSGISTEGLKAAGKSLAIDSAISAATLGTFSSLRLLGGVTKGAPNPGDKVYRVWGDGAGANGRSWSRTDPRTVDNYRDAAGLPKQNSGRFVTEGTLTNTKSVTQRDALPLHGNKGGLDELVVPNPTKQIRTDRVSGVNPEF